jgi:predicted MFS family arabinose efflux permease
MVGPNQAITVGPPRVDIPTLLVAGAVLAVGRWLVGRLTGRWLDATLRRTPLTVALAAALVLALWVNQQAHAALLR